MESKSQAAILSQHLRPNKDHQVEPQMPRLRHPRAASVPKSLLQVDLSRSADTTAGTSTVV